MKTVVLQIVFVKTVIFQDSLMNRKNSIKKMAILIRKGAIFLKKYSFIG